MKGFALVADKCDCVEAMRHVSCGMFAILNVSDLEWPDEHDMYRLVTAAYLLDQPKHFRDLTRQLVLACGNKFWRSDDRDTELLPSHLLSSLQAQQMSATQELTFRLTSFICTFTSSAFAKREPYYIHDLLEQLEMHSVWPLNVGTLGLQMILNRLRAVHVPIMERDTTSLPATHRYSRPNHHYDYYDAETRPSSRQSFDSRDSTGWSAIRKSEQSTKADLDSVIDRVSEHCIGLCLDCFKGNDFCRQPHSDLDGETGAPSIISQDSLFLNRGANW